MTKAQGIGRIGAFIADFFDIGEEFHGCTFEEIFGNGGILQRSMETRSRYQKRNADDADLED
jgi:hypothetical protein